MSKFKPLPLFAILLVVCALTVTWAAGTTGNVSWTAPATYNDGSALPASDIAFYTVSWQFQPGGAIGSVKVNAPQTTAVVPVPCGSADFTVSVTTNATARYPNATSAATSPVSYASGVACAPNPPTDLAVH